jgi:hypothetical protein
MMSISFGMKLRKIRTERDGTHCKGPEYRIGDAGPGIRIKGGVLLWELANG